MKTTTHNGLSQYLLMIALGISSVAVAIHCGNGADDGADEDVGRLQQSALSTDSFVTGTGQAGFKRNVSDPDQIALTYGFGNGPVYGSNYALDGNDSNLCTTTDDCPDDPEGSGDNAQGAANTLTADPPETDGLYGQGWSERAAPPGGLEADQLSDEQVAHWGENLL